MKKIIYFFLFLLVLITLPSCNNEIDMCTEWKETTVVYSLLDSDDSISYIKVNKAFLGNENALVMADIRDSSEYNQIDVKLEKYLNNKLVQTFIFEPIEIDNKEDGIFYNPYQTIYAANTYGQLNSSFSTFPDTVFTYKIVITNNSNETVWSQIYLINDKLHVTKPIDPHDGRLPTINFPNNTIAITTVEWDTVPFAKYYKVDADFYFWEIHTSGDTIVRSIPWNNLRTVYSKPNDNRLSFHVNSIAFYELLKRDIPYKDGDQENKVIKRRPGNFVLNFKMAGHEYYNYVNNNNMSSGLSQEIPIYTNVENGIGLVSARHKISFTCQLAEQAKNSLYSDSQYDFLKFVNW
jgi:hypothetical protein